MDLVQLQWISIHRIHAVTSQSPARRRSSTVGFLLDLFPASPKPGRVGFQVHQLQGHWATGTTWSDEREGPVEIPIPPCPRERTHRVVYLRTRNAKPDPAPEAGLLGIDSCSAALHALHEPVGIGRAFIDFGQGDGGIRGKCQGGKNGIGLRFFSFFSLGLHPGFPTRQDPIVIPLGANQSPSWPGCPR